MTKYCNAVNALSEEWYLKFKENGLPGKWKQMHCPNQVLHDDNWRRAGGGGVLASRPKNSRNNWRGGTDRCPVRRST